MQHPQPPAGRLRPRTTGGIALAVLALTIAAPGTVTAQAATAPAATHTVATARSNAVVKATAAQKARMLRPSSGSRKKITYSCKTSGVPRTISTYAPSSLRSGHGAYMRPSATVSPIRIASGIAVTDNLTVTSAAATSATSASTIGAAVL